MNSIPNTGLSRTDSGKTNPRKLALTAMLSALAFVLCTFVYFPSMAPFQHLVNVVAGVLLGPWYALAAALLTGLMRMATGRTIQAVVGAVFGAFLAGLFYRRTGKLWCALAGEALGTGFLSAMAAYPLMRLFYGLDAQSPLYYIPFYLPSSLLGASMGYGILMTLRRTGVLTGMLARLEGQAGGTLS